MSETMRQAAEEIVKWGKIARPAVLYFESGDEIDTPPVDKISALLLEAATVLAELSRDSDVDDRKRALRFLRKLDEPVES